MPWRFVLMIPREARMATWHLAANPVPSWGWPGCPASAVVRDDRDRLLRFLRLGSEHFSGPGPRGRHTELPPSWARTRRRGVPDVVAHLVRLDFLLTEKLAHGALSQMVRAGDIEYDPPPVRARAHLAGQKPCRPQFMRIAVLLGLVAGQRYQPGPWPPRRDHRLFARSRSVIKCRKRAIGHRSLDAALHRLMMHAKSSSHGKERWLLPIAEQHAAARDTRPAGSVRDRDRAVSASISSPGHRQPRPLAAILP